MKFLFVALLTVNLFGASNIQIEKYMSLSSGTEFVTSEETRLSRLQKLMGAKKNYDFAQFELRFKNKIGELLSENDMQKILDNYKNLLYARVSHEILGLGVIYKDLKDINKYHKEIKDIKNQKARLKIIKEITDNMLNNKILAIYFTKTIEPFIKRGDDRGADFIKTARKKFYKYERDTRVKVLNYKLQDLSLDDLKNLAKFTKKSSVYNEQKTLIEATAYAVEDYINILVKKLN